VCKLWQGRLGEREREAFSHPELLVLLSVITSCLVNSIHFLQHGEFQGTK